MCKLQKYPFEYARKHRSLGQGQKRAYGQVLEVNVEDGSLSEQPTLMSKRMAGPGQALVTLASNVFKTVKTFVNSR
jgi:hypothetical protein